MELFSLKIDALFVKSEKCFVLAGRREKTNTFKAPFYVVTHEMCSERERERVKKRPITWSIFSHLNRLSTPLKESKQMKR
jgi:hypothetical protein